VRAAARAASNSQRRLASRVWRYLCASPVCARDVFAFDAEHFASRSVTASGTQRLFLHAAGIDVRAALPGVSRAACVLALRFACALIGRRSSGDALARSQAAAAQAAASAAP